MSGRLTEGFRDMIELKWSEFVELERSLSATNFDAIIASVARAAAKGNLRSIQTALDRLDGKIAAEIEVEYPKFYTLYPNATKKTDDSTIIDADENGEIKGVLVGTVITGVNRIEVIDAIKEPAPEELPTGSLRAVLDKMLDTPKTVPVAILKSVELIDNDQEAPMNPQVKSVIVAGLMKLVHDGRMSAVFEVFDQIDGKVVDKYKVLGDDVYMTNFSEIAPAGAVKNADGIYQIAADNVTNSWVTRLEEKNARKNNR